MVFYKGEIKGFVREEHLDIPVEALREALTNALCHRQYEKYNLCPSIAIYDDRVEIENPGRLPEPYFTTEQGYVTIVFLRPKSNGFGENRGENRGENLARIDENKNTYQLTERQQTILSLLKENPFLTAKELSVSMSVTVSVTPRTIERDIATLRDLGLIRRKGRKNSGHWEIIDNN